MFDAIRNNKRIVQIFILAIAVPFAVWGLDVYFRGGGNEDIARIGRAHVSVNAFQKALREEQERMRRGRPDSSLADFNTQAIREAVLDDLVNRQLILTEAQKRGLNARLVMQQIISEIPEFQENGRFSPERYEAAWKTNTRRTQGEFEAEMREDLFRQTIMSAVYSASFTPQTVTRRILALQTEAREVQESLIPWSSLVDKAGNVTEEEARQFYTQNAPLFTSPEQMRAEFVVLTRSALKDDSKASEAELRAWYDSHREHFVKEPEKRRIRHILRTTEGSDKEKVRAEAAKLLDELKSNPSRFAELASAHSQDPGSARQGGDLGFLVRQGLVTPFADAAFSQKKGELSGLVESEFGFHIIRVDEIHPIQYFSFAEARPRVEAAFREQSMTGHFAEAAENFANLVYEESDSLKPTANAYHLAIEHSDWLVRGQARPQPKFSGPEDRAAFLLLHPRMAKGLFSEEVVKNGRNSEVVEIEPGVLVAARVLEHKPEFLLPFEEVKQGIMNRLRAEKAQALAVKQGEEKLAALRGKDEPTNRGSQGNWGKRQTISRIAPGALYPEAVDAILRVRTDSLPAYAGVEIPGRGYAIYRIVSASASKLDPELEENLSDQIGNFSAQALTHAYITALRQRYKVKINENLLRDKESQ